MKCNDLSCGLMGSETLILGPHISRTSTDGVDRYSQERAANADGLAVRAPTGQRSTTLPDISDASAASTYVPISMALPRPTVPSMLTPATCADGAHAESNHAARDGANCTASTWRSHVECGRQVSAHLPRGAKTTLSSGDGRDLESLCPVVGVV